MTNINFIPMPLRSADDMRKVCRETLEVMMKYCGYHFAPTHAIQDNSPVENIITMYQLLFLHVQKTVTQDLHVKNVLILTITILFPQQVTMQYGKSQHLQA